MNNLSNDITLAMSLLDLPIDLHQSYTKTLDCEYYGASWYFLTCDSNDDYIDVVQEILSLCSYHQIKELCFMRGPIKRNKRFGLVNGQIVGPEENDIIPPPTFIGSVISRATPKCKLQLRIALRFMGRYEFLSSKAISNDKGIGCKVFYALDYGTDDDPINHSSLLSTSSTDQLDVSILSTNDDVENEPNQKVILKCYSVQESYDKETGIISKFIQKLDCKTKLEVINFFKVTDIDNF